MGFINTLVLIASSVFVVFSWVALKERSWKRFQIWMAAVIACAGIFLVIKGIEYKKKFSHYGIELQDGSLLEAEILKGSDRLRFEANEVSVNLNSGSLVFLGMLDDDLPRFKAPEGAHAIVRGGYSSIDELPDRLKKKFPKSGDGTVDLKSWVAKAGKLLADAQKEKRARIKEVDHHNAKVAAAMAEAEEKGVDYEGPELMGYEDDDDDDPNNGNYWKGITEPLESKATLVAVEPFKLHARTSKVSGGRAAKVEKDGKEVDVINFVDSSQVAGTLIDDAVYVDPAHIHDIDLQRIRTEEGQRSAMVWDLLKEDSHTKGLEEQFFAHREARLEKLDKHYGSRSAVPARQLHSREVNVFHVEHGAHAGGHDDHHGGGAAGHGDKAHDDGDHGHGDNDKPETGGASDDADDPTAATGHMIKIPRDQIVRVSNHGPQYGTYYAIYFTMTGLHGLHVIGGAIVLAYFLFFGKKLFLKNPEHMANRVEVGGLFWHFVDLVWIFLFPIMYLF